MVGENTKLNYSNHYLTQELDEHSQFMQEKEVNSASDRDMKVTSFDSRGKFELERTKKIHKFPRKVMNNFVSKVHRQKQ